MFDIKKIRQTLRLSQAELSQALGISQTYLSLLENGKRRITKDIKNKVLKICLQPEKHFDYKYIKADIAEREKYIDINFGVY